jgi:hypothetical protein
MAVATIKVDIDDPESMALIAANLYKQGLAFNVESGAYQFVITITGY